MFRVYFDDSDSYILRGIAIYFNKEENILPYIKEKLKPHAKEIYDEYGQTIEEYCNHKYPAWYIDKIKTID